MHGLTKRRMFLTSEHEKMWRDADTYSTNADAAAAISAALSRTVAIDLLRKTFGPSGRPAGGKTKCGKTKC